MVAAILVAVSLLALPAAWALGRRSLAPTPSPTPKLTTDAQCPGLGPLAFDLPRGWLAARPQDHTSLASVILAPTPVLTQSEDVYLGIVYVHQPAAYEPFDSLEAWLEHEDSLLFRADRTPYASHSGLQGFKVPDESSDELYFLEVPTGQYVRVQRTSVHKLDSQIDALLLSARYQEVPKWKC